MTSYYREPPKLADPGTQEPSRLTSVSAQLDELLARQTTLEAELTEERLDTQLLRMEIEATHTGFIAFVATMTGRFREINRARGQEFRPVGEGARFGKSVNILPSSTDQGEVTRLKSELQQERNRMTALERKLGQARTQVIKERRLRMILEKLFGKVRRELGEVSVRVGGFEKRIEEHTSLVGGIGRARQAFYQILGRAFSSTENLKTGRVQLEHELEKLSYEITKLSFHSSEIQDSVAEMRDSLEQKLRETEELVDSSELSSDSSDMDFQEDESVLKSPGPSKAVQPERVTHLREIQLRRLLGKT